MKKVIIIILFLLCLSLLGCKNNDYKIIGPNNVKLGEEIILECDCHNNTIKWSSSDSATALILSSSDSEALIKGVGLGEAIITVTIGKNIIEHKITVEMPEVYIEIEGPNVLLIGAKVKYNSNVLGEWSSSNPNIIEIDDNGEAIAKEAGEAILSITFGDKLESINVKVYPKDFELSLECNDLLLIGEETKINIKTNIDLNDLEINYSSSDSNVITVSEDGFIKAIGKGKASVTASVLGKNTTLTIEVILDSDLIRISGENVIRLDQSFFLTCNYDCYWSSDSEILDISEEGELYPFAIGKCTICATDKNNPNNKAYFEIEVIGKAPKRIMIDNKDYVGVGQIVTLNVLTFPNNASKRFVYESNNPFVASVDNNGNVNGLNEGEAVITIYSFEDLTIFSEITLKVTKPAPVALKLTGNNTMMQGAHNILDLEIIGEGVNPNVTWSSSDNKIAIVFEGIVLAVNKGEVNIRVESSLDSEIFDEIQINVIPYTPQSESASDLERVNEILSKMILEQKIGQMFVVGFSGTEMPNDLKNAIATYHFGNVIYMGANVTDVKTLAKMSNDIQEEMIKENGVGAFICTDQEGGTVARLKVGATHFISNMAMGATNDYNNTYLQGMACGKELRNYGINVDFAPVLDVNNNPNNPVIGIRSYGDNPLKVSLYGKNMYMGLMESNVMGSCKHFPGHGNTSTDSHYGLPTITTPMNELYQTELAPYISSIANGIDAIMTTHIIFSAIDKNYPATLSYKVLTNLLREELGFNGVIFTDGMEMAAVANNFGDYDKTGVMAVKAGADVLTYTSISNPIKAYNALLKAVKNGEISEERINESVTRILLKKLKYDIIDDPYAKNEDISLLLEEDSELNNQFACDALTLVRGEFNGLDSEKRAIIISPVCSNTLQGNLNSNSLGAFATKYLTSLGFDVEYMDVSNNISSSERKTALSLIDDFDTVVLAFSNIRSNNYTNTIKFVQDVCKLDKEVIVIGLQSPYDLLSYGDSVKNYVNVYCYQNSTVYAITKFLSGENEAKGISSIELK